MLTVLAVLMVVALPMLAVSALLVVSEALQRRRARRVAAQIRLTDAVHRELGAIVAPLVTRRWRAPWRVEMALAPEHRWAAPRLLALAEEVLGAESRAPVQVVLSHAPGRAVARPACSPARPRAGAMSARTA